MDLDTIFGLQEVTVDIEDKLRKLAPNTLFSPRHKVCKNGKLNKNTGYQGVGFSTSFEMNALTDEEVGDINKPNKVLNKVLNRVPEDPYSFEMILNDVNNKKAGKHHRYIQIVKVRIDGVDRIFVNVHYHYNLDVIEQTNVIMRELVSKLKPDVMMGDFNSIPLFDGYLDLLANERTFHKDLNNTSNLDHIFIRNDVYEVWNVSKPKELFDLIEINSDNIEEHIQNIQNEDIRSKLETLQQEYKTYKSKLENGEKVSRKKTPKEFILMERNNEVTDQILSDHKLFIFKVSTNEGSEFCLATLNVLAPHSSTTFFLHSTLRDRILDPTRLDELVDVIGRSCNSPFEYDEMEGGMDYKLKYLKYKAKYEDAKRRLVALKIN